jgi:hypothetical protein
MPLSASEIADQAADLLAATGWCRNIDIDNWGRHCLTGAINEVTFGKTRSAKESKSRDELLVELISILGLEVPLWASHDRPHYRPELIVLTAWNDRQYDRRKVIRKLRDAAKSLRTKGR